MKAKDQIKKTETVDFEIIATKKDYNNNTHYYLFDVRTPERLPEGHRFFWVNEAEFKILNQEFCIV